jgi:endogenous inhibitor of DNA gyrase (YacG/DUF329 family)
MSTTLVKCPDCHGNISVSATSCPKCGRPFQSGELAALIPPPPPPPTPADKAVVIASGALGTFMIVGIILLAVIFGLIVMVTC